MKRMNKIVFLICLAALPACSALAQDSATAGLTREMDAYRAAHVQEKVYVHTDKEFYLAGEICWFKMYLVDASLHQPLDLSKVAYLEWLDRDNRPVLQAKIALRDGHGDGSVYLPMTIHSGHYKLRAYTSWMKNFGSDGFFEKAITVVNARKSGEAPPLPAARQYAVSFFPEGGNLVNGLASTVGVKIADQYGQSTECTGVITEDDQDTVARFQTQRFGLGSFAFTPRSGHRYRSTARLADGTAITNLLPAAFPEGMVMHVSATDGDRIRVDVQSTILTADIYLLADTRQSVKAEMKEMLKDGKASFLMERRQVGEGISHLTVFDNRRQPVCERLVFRQPSQPLELTVKANQPTYGTRKKISLHVSSVGDGNSPVAADCSVAVFRVDSLQTATSGHIFQYLWLGSDLKGRIESPGYYLDHPEDREAMDNLLLTQGWRRFRWEDVQSQKPPAFEFPLEFNGAIISGKVVDARTGNPATRHIQGYLSVPGTRTQFTSATCDEGGRIHFELKDFFGAPEVIAQTNPEDSAYRIDINNPFSERYTETPLPMFQFPRLDSGLLTDKSVAIQVLNRYGGERLKQFALSPGVDTIPFYHKSDYAYLLDDYTRFTTMEEVMREYVVLMGVQRRQGHFHLPLLDLSNKQFFANDPLILLDGVPVFNIDSLMIIDPLKIRKLETVHRRYFMGSVNYTGIMNWTSYKGDLAGFLLDPRATVVDYEGLQMEREFYAPVYATDEQVASHLPDFRNVLYWAPILLTDRQGSGALSFYSSDLPGKYVIVVEGLTADGKAGSGIGTFEVE
jgi:hypothetical protein